jgi:hypothetical protein
MPRIELAFTGPQQWAHDAFHSRPGKPVTVNMPWGRGSGKSWFGRTEAIHLSVAENYGIVRANALKPFRGVRIIGLCPTLKQFRDIHGAQLESELAGEWRAFGGKLNRSTLRIDWPDGSWFQPMPAQTASSKAARGQRCDVIFPDECDDIPIDVFDSVARPWFSERWSLKRTLAGGTPRMGRNGLLYKLHLRGISEDPRDARYFSKIATWKDSPELVDPEEVEDAKRDTDPATFAREWECDFDSAGGLVFPTFDPKFHVREPPSNVRFNRYALGVDHGWEHPGAFIFVGISGHGRDEVAWVLDEEVASQRENEKWDAIARDRFSGIRAWADPSRPDRISSLRRAGLNIQAADNSVEPGIQTIANLMFIRREDSDEYGYSENAWARLYVSPRCENLIAELGTYKRKADPNRPGKFLDEVVKVGDDCCDALRYALIGEFGAPFQGNYRNEAPGR